jgi:phytoene dehydrogenase-like protein
MEKKFKDLGGKITYGKGVSRIILERKTAAGVELEDGSIVSGDYIIPTVDTHLLFGRMLPETYMPKELKEAYNNPKAYPATSGFQVAFAVPVDFNEGETIFIDIDPVEVGSSKFDRMYVKSYGYDNIFIKDGRQVIQTCITQSDSDYEYWKSLSKEEYAALKDRLTAEVEARIVKAFPALEGKMEHLDSWTPLTYERYCNAYHGSYMSFVTTPEGKPIKMKGTIKGINNLYVAGQWTNSPGGLPVAVASGKFAVQRILKKNGRDINI